MARDHATSGKAPQTQGASILPLFPLLSSHDLPTRLDAAVSLLSTLPAIASTSQTPAAGSSADTEYTVKRLVTGLGSANEAARQGFATALTELLSRLPHQDAAATLPVIISASTPNAGSDSKEERELLFGRLFGLHAFLRSGVATSTQADDEELFKEAISALVSLANKKTWIRESAYWVIVDAVRSLLALKGTKAPKFKAAALAWAAQRVLNDPREKSRGMTPDNIALVLVLQSVQTDIDFKSILSPTFPTGNVLARSSLPALAQALKGSVGGADSTGKGPSAGANAIQTSKATSAILNAAPHFVWAEIFEVYFPTQTGARSIEGNARWADFWRVIVDQSHFAPPSIPLKAIGFALLSMALKHVPAPEVAGLFGENVVRTFGNNLKKTSDTEKTLGKTATKFVSMKHSGIFERVAERRQQANTLVTFLSNNQAATFEVLKTLVSPPYGSHTFDVKTIEKIVNKLDMKGTRSWVRFLRESILITEVETEPIEDVEDGGIVNRGIAARRMWAFDQLLHVAKATAVPKDDELLAELLEFFAVLGWFDVRKSGTGARSYSPSPMLTEAQQLAARSRFFSILTVLLASKDVSAQAWLSRALALFANLTNDKKHFTPRYELAEDLDEARSIVQSMYEALTGDDQRQKAARSLIEGVLLLSYDEGEETVEALEQLSDCLPLLFPDILPAKISNEKSDDDEDAEGEEPEPATVLVDLVLELLHRPSAFVKGVAQRAFVSFSEDLTDQGMELLLEQIRPEVSDSQEGEGDVEMGDGETEADAAEDSDSSDDDEDDDTDDEDIEVDEAFKNELLAALQESGVAADLASDGDESEEKEEEYLDDDQMLALDDKLADIFRHNGGGRKSKKLAWTEDMHYRLRVVDLVEALYKAHPASPLLISAALPLFGISRSASSLEEELRVKASKLLRQLVQSKKEQISPDAPEPALEALAELHALAQGIDSADMAPLCAQTAIFLVKAALASPTATTETATQISELFADSFETYVTKKNSKTKVQPALTVEFAKRSPACAWPMFERLLALQSLDANVKPVNAFRLLQTFEVAQSLVAAYSSTRTTASKQDILAKMPAYHSTIVSTVRAAIDSKENVVSLDASRLRELLKAALAAIRQTTAAADGKSTAVTDAWKIKDWEVVYEQARVSDRFRTANGLLNALKQLVGVLDGLNSKSVKDVKNKSGKRKATDEEQVAKEHLKPAAQASSAGHGIEAEVSVPIVKPGKKQKKEKKQKV
ncbi:DNA-directed DNA polymerase [Microbotryomycetes sp. JL201]|nr:DNA-directed DNA polymerase [Microbotryomycetes sp. JL201]